MTVPDFFGILFRTPIFYKEFSGESKRKV